MTNYNQQRFDIGVEAAHAWWELQKQGEKASSDISEEYASPSEDHLHQLNRLYAESDYAWGNKHVFKAIADTVFGSFMFDHTRDSSPEELDQEIGVLMSGVNGYPVVEVKHFIEPAEASV